MINYISGIQAPPVQCVWWFCYNYLNISPSSAPARLFYQKRLGTFGQLTTARRQIMKEPPASCCHHNTFPFTRCWVHNCVLAPVCLTTRTTTGCPRTTTQNKIFLGTPCRQEVYLQKYESVSSLLVSDNFCLKGIQLLLSFDWYHFIL